MKGWLAIRYVLCTSIAFFAIAMHYCSAQALPKLIPYRDGDKWGYADTNGNVIIAPQWERAELFVTSGKAKVAIYKTLPSGELFSAWCLIDTLGRYIIPPERGWSGYFHNPDYQMLNAGTEYRAGAIDSNNKVIIPLEYDRKLTHPVSRVYPLWNKKFFQLAKNNRWGILGIDGKVIIPFQYASVDTLPYAPAPMFITGREDSGYMYLLMGVIDTHNKILIPHKYTSIVYTKSGSMKGFVVTDTNDKAAWIDYPSFKTLIQPYYNDVRFFERDKLIASIDRKYGIVNTQKKVLLPLEYDGVYISGDTAFAYRHNSDYTFDSVFLFSTHTYKLIGATRNAYPTAEIFDASQLDHRSDIQQEICMPHAGRCITSFKKDSIHWKVMQVAHRKRQYYAVISIDSITEQKKAAAVVDTAFNYIVSPTPDHTIYTYHPESGIMLVSNDAKRGFDVMDTNWNIMSTYCGNSTVMDVLKWKNKIYYMIDSGNYHVYLVTGGGIVPSRFRGYWFAGITDSAGYYLRGFHYFGGGSVLDDITGYFVVSDGKNTGFITADGKILYPEISFKSGVASGVGYGYFNTSDREDNKYAFVNSENKALLDTKYSYAREETTAFGFSGNSYGYVVKGVFKVEYRDRDYRLQHVYVDKYGRIYGKNLSLLQKK